MIKKLLITFLLFYILNAYNISDIIEYESQLYPKIIDLITSSNKKIVIIYNQDSLKYAEKLKKLINYKNIVLISENQIINSHMQNYKAVIFTFKNIQKKLINKLVENKVLIFNIYPDEITNSMFTLYIGVKIKPYINISLIKKANLNINPILLTIGEIYEN